MEKAQQLAGQVQEKATQRVESGLSRGKNQAAQTLSTVAESLIVSSQQLRERNEENVSRYVDQVADRVQRVSSYLQNTDVSEIVDRTEEFARRRPALFLGGAFAIGLLGARFLKSSRRREAGGGKWEAGGGTGQGFSRRTAALEQEVPTARPQQEWAAGGATASGFADIADPRVQTQPLSESGFGRRQGSLDYDLPPGSPGSAQR